MKKILREPLLHFLVLGAALFLVHGLVSRSKGDEPGEIVITQGQINSLVDGFALAKQRPPTSDELQGLVRDAVRQQVYYREALALGLDKDDLIIRRRLEQKLQFISDDIAAQIQPTDSQLNAFLQAHADQFRLQQKFSFRQLFLDPEKHGANLASDAAQLLTKLNKVGGDVALTDMGDPLPLDDNIVAVSASEVASQFGEQFVAKLAELSPGQWEGPVQSAFGAHLVFISKRTDTRVPELAEVRDAVRREWDNVQRLEQNEKFYRQLLGRYTVTVEQFDSPQEEEKKLAVAK